MSKIYDIWLYETNGESGDKHWVIFCALSYLYFQEKDFDTEYMDFNETVKYGIVFQ